MLPEQDAFIEKLYHEFFTQLWIYAKAALGDPEQAQEVVQDTFHEAVRHIGILTAHDNPKGWLMDVLKRKLCTLAVRGTVTYFTSFLWTPIWNLTILYYQLKIQF